MSRLRALGRGRSLELLASVPLGRVVFTERALPAIRPVNHLVDGDSVVIRSTLGSALVGAALRKGGIVVAYEADQIDVTTHAGWSVVVTGTAHLVQNESDVTRYENLLHSWVDLHMDCVVRIQADLVDGYELQPS
jgi:nitroimidazol reductase NimA-like FMN-containing flavoprotein (pyridoxamine 5'-phosphate oxidase superfamily)